MSVLPQRESAERCNANYLVIHWRSGKAKRERSESISLSRYVCGVGFET